MDLQLFHSKQQSQQQGLNQDHPVWKAGPWEWEQDQVHNQSGNHYTPGLHAHGLKEGIQVSLHPGGIQAHSVLGREKSEPAM